MGAITQRSIGSRVNKWFAMWALDFESRQDWWLAILHVVW
jgi:hypothetical protein